MGFIKPTFKDWILDFQFLKYIFYKWHICILLGMYIVAFFIGFLFWKSCKFWRRLRALDYIWKSGVGFTLFYFTNLFVEILGRKGSGTMIFIVSWCYGGLAMVMFILFWQGSYPPWWHRTGMFHMQPGKFKAIPVDVSTNHVSGAAARGLVPTWFCKDFSTQRVKVQGKWSFETPGGFGGQLYIQ